LAHFRALIDSSSPQADAEALRDAGLEVIGPWAAEAASPDLLVAEEHEVSVLIDASDSEAALAAVEEIVGDSHPIKLIEVENR